MAYKNWAAIACFGIASATILGAFGAHALKAKLDPTQLESYKTGVLYLMLNSIAILALGKLIYRVPGVLIWVGTLLFSLSIVILSTRTIWLDNTTAFSWLGPVTPLGGSLIIAGWIWTGIKISQSSVEN
ncbi:DUF423 domain-containing protein [Luteibaculum oceani]|uniref:DUF423 domain-containing protein n=1 Tax=Luteibaculum oceani TaxID=1294296 RepID=A0A5C6V8T9_9FLAO|nr:DUF423 domain-containing protein [Luteibaculum oceani]TXC81467.1 DUF423 domain-containing protein [Luteibaculum oceani]